MKTIQTFDYHGMPMHLNADRIVAVVQSDEMRDNQATLPLVCNSCGEAFDPEAESCFTCDYINKMENGNDQHG